MGEWDHAVQWLGVGMSDILATVRKGITSPSTQGNGYYIYTYLDGTVRSVNDAGTEYAAPAGSDGVYQWFVPEGSIAWYGVGTGPGAPNLFGVAYYGGPFLT